MMKVLKITLTSVLCASLAYPAEVKQMVKQIMPPGTKPGGPFSPGILAGEFLYVAGQGAKSPDGKLPADKAEQIRQCLRNVKTVVEAAGLTMQHVVYVQAYLMDYSDEDLLNRVWKEFFPTAPPARSTIGVAALSGTTVEMSAVAVKDLSLKKPVVPSGYPSGAMPISPAVLAGDRLYLSGFLGRDIHTGKVPEDPAEQVELAFTRLHETLAAAGADFANLVFVNPYLTRKIPAGVMNKIYAKHFEMGNTPARATIEVAGLPNGANIEFTGVAVLDLSKRRAVRPKNMEPSPTASPCVLAGDTFYCSAKSGFIPGVNGGIYASTVETQLRQTMRNLLDGLEEAGMNFSNVVASNVYLDNVEDFPIMNGVYTQYFGVVPPARTTVEQVAPVVRGADAKGHWPTLEQISIVAVK
jgi:enamine deaminase RidA (YjgF/YER057c/UK114 family)